MADQKRDKALYEQWVNEHSGELFRYCFRLCGRRDIAEDLVQETFFEAWKSMRSLKDRAKGRAWLYQILRFRYSHWLRKDRQRQQVAGAAQQQAAIADSAHHDVDRLAERDALQRALDQLDERFRAPLLLVYMEGLSCQEAADELGVPLGTVLSRIHRARAALRKSLDDGEGGDRDDSGWDTSVLGRVWYGGAS